LGDASKLLSAYQAQMKGVQNVIKFSRLVAAARKRRRDEEVEEEGFTLIELLVVLLIIGILLAIAIPTFLSVTKTAGDTAVQSNLQSALTNAKTSYLSGGADSYTTLQANWAGLDSGLSAGTTDASVSTGPQSVSLEGTGSIAVMVIYSNATSRCWGIADQTAAVAGSGDSLTTIPNASFPATVYFYYPATTGGANCSASTVETSGVLAATIVSGGAASSTGWPQVP
jgi:type IV pilus assembly protein PilA